MGEGILRERGRRDLRFKRHRAALRSATNDSCRHRGVRARALVGVTRGRRVRRDLWAGGIAQQLRSSSPLLLCLCHHAAVNVVPVGGAIAIARSKRREGQARTSDIRASTEAVVLSFLPALLSNPQLPLTSTTPCLPTTCTHNMRARKLFPIVSLLAITGLAAFIGSTRVGASPVANVSRCHGRKLRSVLTSVCLLP